MWATLIVGAVICFIGIAAVVGTLRGSWTGVFVPYPAARFRITNPLFWLIVPPLQLFGTLISVIGAHIASDAASPGRSTLLDTALATNMALALSVALTIGLVVAGALSRRRRTADPARASVR